jgi:hypothetical protein
MFIDGHRTAHYGYANFRCGIVDEKIERENKEPTRGGSPVAKICEEWNNNDRARDKINFGAILECELEHKSAAEFTFAWRGFVVANNGGQCCMSCR